MLNTFLWKDKKPRVKVELLQQISKAGIAYPSICKYYQASRLAAMALWWKEEEIDTWVFEQQGITTPLKEWVLGDPDLGLKKLRSSNVTCNAIMKTG